MRSTPDAGSERPQPWARPFVVILLATFVTCGVLGIEAWPLSGFRLFSSPRSSLAARWQLLALTADGERVPVNVSRLGAAYKGFGFVARSFDDLSSAERAALCTVWLRAASSIGIDAVGLMLVKVEQRLRPRDRDGPLTEPRQTVQTTCPAEATT